MLVIRLARAGRKGERKFRIVVKEKRDKRDGKAVETLGHYTKRMGGIEEKKVDKKRVEYWVSKGAQITEAVKNIL